MIDGLVAVRNTSGEYVPREGEEPPRYNQNEGYFFKPGETKLISPDAARIITSNPPGAGKLEVVKPGADFFKAKAPDFVIGSDRSMNYGETLFHRQQAELESERKKLEAERAELQKEREAMRAEIAELRKERDVLPPRRPGRPPGSKNKPKG